MDPEELRKLNEDKLKDIDKVYLNKQGEDKDESIYTRNGIKDSDGMKPWED